MIKVTYLPAFMTRWFHGMPALWKDQHRLILTWLIVMQALFPGRKTIAELARWIPINLTEWRFRRLLKATYWDVHALVDWWAHQAISLLPPPEDGVLTLTGDGSDKPKKGKKNPLAKKGRKSKHDPWFFGVRFALLMGSWDGCRLPVAFRLIRPKSHPKYQTENELFREMVAACKPPAWAKVVIVEGDAAYGSQDHMKMVIKRKADDPDRTWGFVFAIPRPWKTVEGKAIKDWVTHLPRKYDRSTWVPRIPAAGGRRSFWVSHTRLCLRHVGDVTGVLSKTGRNVGPSKTKILVTNRTELTPRYIVYAYQKRWAVGVSSKGHMNPVGESPTEVTSSSLVAWEAP